MRARALVVLLVLAAVGGSSVLARQPALLMPWSPAAPVGVSPSPRAPALAVFKGVTYAAWILPQPRHSIMVASRAASGQFEHAHQINTTDASPDSPAMAAFGDRLCLVWRANDQSRGLYFSCNANPASMWRDGRRLEAVSDVAPAIVEYKKQLHIFWRADRHQIFSMTSKDGEKWVRKGETNPIDFSTEAPAVAVFDGRIYMAFKANDESNQILIASSKDADEWPKGQRIKTGDSTPHRPALSATPAGLVLAWTSDNLDHQMFVSTSSDGKKWTQGQVAGKDFVSTLGPGLASGVNETCLAWTATSGGDRLRISCAGMITALSTRPR